MNDTSTSHIWAYPIVVKAGTDYIRISERAGCDDVGKLHTFEVSVN